MNNFSPIAKFASDSYSIKLASVTVSSNLNNASQQLTYSGTFGTCGNTMTFSGLYLQTGTNHQVGVLVKADPIRINFATTRGINAGEDIRKNFIHKRGTPTNMLFTVADVINTQRVYLYP